MKHFIHLLVILPILVISLVIIYSAPTYANTYLEDTSEITVTENGSYTIIDGVTEGDLTLTKKGTSTEVPAHVILVKPYAKAKFKPIIPGYYTEGSTAAERATKADSWDRTSWSVTSLSKMVVQYESAADTEAGSVVAAINGDFGISTPANGVVPRGSVILEGNKELVHPAAADDEFFFGYKDNGALNIVQRITGQKDDFSEALCGAAFILRNGSVFGVENETESRQRTGIAYKTNGDVLLITVESGISVKQLAYLMKASGCWNGINMDGGGSTTFLSKREGENLTRRTPDIATTYSDRDDNGERMIPSGLLLVADDNAVANNVPLADDGNVPDSVATDKDTYVAGDAINVTASTNSDGAWVSLQKFEDDGSFNVNSLSYFWYYAYGDNDGGTWCWENGATYDICKDAVCNQRDGVTSSGGLPAGNYRVSLANYVDPENSSAGYKLLAYKDITIEPNPDAPTTYSIATDKDEYEVGDPIMTTATAPDSDGRAWVAVLKHGETLGSNHASYFWYYNSYTNAGISHANGETYNMLDQELISVENYNKLNDDNKALIDRSKRQLLPGTFDITVYVNDGYTVAKDANGNPVTKTITVVDTNAEYSITYRDGNSTITGLTPSSYKYVDAQSGDIPLPESVDKKGHIFTGWYEKSDFSGTPVTSIPKGSSGNKTYYAKFEKQKYTVSFDTDGGTPEIAAQEVLYGDTATEPTEELTKEGEFVFAGWVTEKNGSVPFNFQQPIEGDTTVYARWVITTEYTVIFDSKGGSNVLSQNIEEGGKAVRPDDPEKLGYTFDTWTWEIDGEVVAFDFDNIIFDSTTFEGIDTIVLEANWIPIEYTITYKDGEENLTGLSPTSYTIESETFDLPTDVNKENYTFLGWYEDSDYSGEEIDSIPQGSTGNITLYAKWKREPSLSLNKDEYFEGEAIKVTAYCENKQSWIGLYRNGDEPGTEDLAYYWSWVTDNNGNPVISGEEINLLDPGYKHEQNNNPLEPDKYYVILFKDEGYTPLITKEITIKENTEDPLTGSLELSGYSRDDKTYEGAAASKFEEPPTLYEYFYGDKILVKATVSGLGAEDTWVGIITDDDYSKGTVSSTVDKHWYWTKDYKNQAVALNYMVESVIAEDNELPPFGLNYWVVLVSSSGKIIAGEPFNFRTFNMDWNNVSWGEKAKQKLNVELDWISRLANGEEQKPELTITRVNGLFGYKKDDDGNLVEITEEVLRRR